MFFAALAIVVVSFPGICAATQRVNEAESNPFAADENAMGSAREGRHHDLQYQGKREQLALLLQTPKIYSHRVIEASGKGWLILGLAPSTHNLGKGWGSHSRKSSVSPLEIRFMDALRYAAG